MVQKLNRQIAYTTVMSTLDRLYRKALVSRRRLGRAYLYSPRVTCKEWRDQVARDVVAKLLAGPDASRDVLLACLLEAVAQQGAWLLRELERGRGRLAESGRRSRETCLSCE